MRPLFVLIMNSRGVICLYTESLNYSNINVCLFLSENALYICRIPDELVITILKHLMDGQSYSEVSWEPGTILHLKNALQYVSAFGPTSSFKVSVLTLQGIKFGQPCSKEYRLTTEVIRDKTLCNRCHISFSLSRLCMLCVETGSTLKCCNLSHIWTGNIWINW